MTCPRLSPPTNGKVRASGNSYGSKASYSCHKGYKIVGDDIIRTCQADGSWSGMAPACESMHCTIPEKYFTLSHLVGWPSCYINVQRCRGLPIYAASTTERSLGTTVEHIYDACPKYNELVSFRIIVYLYVSDGSRC